MKTMMLRHMPDDPGWIDDFIGETTGIQTILQMKGFVAELKKRRLKRPSDDPWFYKKEYNDMLMESVARKRQEVIDGKVPRSAYLVPGALHFLDSLSAHGVKVFFASGTDQEDVKIEAAALGIDKYAEAIEGALPRSEKCAKEAALRRLVKKAGVKPGELAVIGDGKVEIMLGKALKARTIGLATNESDFSSVNAGKLARLKKAGAGFVAGDFRDLRPMLEYLGLGANPGFSFKGIRTYDFNDRHNLVTIESMFRPGVDPVPEWPKRRKKGDFSDQRADFAELVGRVAESRRNARPVIFSMGAHVIKNNMSLYLIDLMEKGVFTHISGNGACSIHDFELAALGGTSEDVPTAIEDGSFGMWEQTGGWMNEALQRGVRAGYGYGESIARYIDAHKSRFPFREQCVAYMAWKFGVPATYHIAMGTDIIHQHPSVDFGAIGTATGRDFHTMVNAVSRLDGGAYLNFGSGVIGPEVFLKALSISRNLAYPTFRITTANFDLKPLGDYRCKIGYSDPNYYYRPRKNIVNRPVSCGGKGWHFEGDHKETIPNLWLGLREKGLF
jgi:phosphoglycolate phosphatase-like HAD superfamily hydrolase